MVFQDSFKGVSRNIEGCLKGDLSEFQGYLKEVQRKFQSSFKGVSRRLQGCSKKDFRVLQGGFKGVS